MKLKVFVRGIGEICKSRAVNIWLRVIDQYALTNACVHKIVVRVRKQTGRDLKNLGKVRTGPLAKVNFIVLL
ncbi:hypothetical protein THO17_30200 [Marinomonas sp. THO17]